MAEVEIRMLANSELGKLREDMDAIARSDAAGGFFASPLWVFNYSQFRKQAGPMAKLLAGYDREGRLIGVLPLARDAAWTGLFASLRAAHSTGEYVSDWSCAPGQAAAFFVAAFQYLSRNESRWFQLAMFAVPESSPVLHAARGLCVASHVPYTESLGPLIPIVAVDDPDTPASGLATAKHRRELKRRMRELAKRGDARFEEVRGGMELQARYEEFVAVEGSGWKARDGGAIVCQPDAREFWWQLAKDAAERDCLRLHLLRSGEHAIAGQYGVVVGGRYYCLKVGYDERFRHYGPGALMTQHVLQCCIDDPAIQIYDFSGPAQPYMWNWTSLSYQTLRMSIAAPSLPMRFAFNTRLRCGRGLRTLKLAVKGNGSGSSPASAEHDSRSN